MNLRNVKSALSAGVRMVRGGLPITLVVLACDAGFATSPRLRDGSRRSDPADRAASVHRRLDHSGTVTVDEIVSGVNIALGLLALDQCPEFDAMPSARSRSIASSKRSMRR